MKISVISPYSFSVHGGVNNQVKALIKEFLMLDHQVIVNGIADNLADLTDHFTSDNPKDFFSTGQLEICYLGKSISIPTNGSQANIGLRFKTIINTLAKTPKADVVHMHEPFVPGPALLTLLKPKHSPIVTTFHRSGVDLFYKNYMKLAHYLQYRIDFATAVSNSAQATIKSISNLDPTVLFNGIDPALYRRDTESIQNTSKLKILFVGRLEPRKGLYVLLEAIDTLKDLHSQLEYHIVATGKNLDPQITKYKNYNNVIWYQDLKNEKLLSLYKTSDIFVNPALGSESFGLVLLEAMASGNAVIASDIEPFRAVIKDDGIYFKVGDSADLALSIRKLVSNPSKLKSARYNNPKIANNYSIKTLAQKYISIFQTCIG
jgi:phosphatidylinositol alpha-mannosyltransferase